MYKTQEKPRPWNQPAHRAHYQQYVAFYKLLQTGPSNNPQGTQLYFRSWVLNHSSFLKRACGISLTSESLTHLQLVDSTLCLSMRNECYLDRSDDFYFPSWMLKNFRLPRKKIWFRHLSLNVRGRFPCLMRRHGTAREDQVCSHRHLCRRLFH